MESVEAKYLAIKQKIKSLSEQMKDYRKVLNETASVLLNSSDKYEFTTEDLIISRPTSHQIKKKSKE
mgnify:CR=1 FL=1